MESVAQAGQFLVFFALIFLITIYSSVGVAVGLGRLATDLPWPLRHFADYWRSRSDSATLGSATIGAIVLCFFQIPPLVFLVWPSSHISVLDRLLALLLFVTEAAWLAYLRRYLVSKGE
jgi:hypothetical protein